MPKRVAMIVLNEFRNDSRVIKEASALKNAGYKVKVFALWGEGLLQQEEMEGFEVERIPLRTRSWSKNPAMQAFKYIEFWNRARHRIIKWHPNIVHCHDLNTLPIGRGVAKRTGAELVYDSHELWSDPVHKMGMPKLFLDMGINMEKGLIKKADGTITVCKSISDYLSKLYDVAPPVVVKNVPISMSIGKSDLLRQEFGIPKDRRIIIYQGNMTKGRGLFNLVKAMSYVDGAVLVLMGRGNIISELKSSARDLGLLDKIYFKEAVPPGEVLLYTASADIGVSPIENVCLSYYYCLPNKLFEYILSGIPVCSSDFPEMSKIVKGHDIGEVFDPDDPEDMGRALNDVLDRYTHYKENVERTKGVYSWEQEQQRLLELYDRLSRPKVLMMSSVHPWDDPRLLHKEAVSLSKVYNVQLYAVAPFKRNRYNDVDVFGLPEFKSRKRRIKNIVRLLGVSLRSRVEVVHFHDPELLPVGMLIKKWTDKKVIYDVHEDYEKAILSKFWIKEHRRRRIGRKFRNFERKVSPKFDAIITVTDDIAKKFPRDMTYLVRNYPLDVPFNGAKKFDGDIQLIYVGALTRIRGIKELVEAMDYIESDRNVRLLLVGSFDEDAFEDEIRSLAHDRNVAFTGRVGHDRIYDYLNDSHMGLVCLKPAEQYITSLPVKMFEYMAAGLPVVCSDFPLWRSIVEGDDCGVVVNPVDPRDIGMTITELLRVPERLYNMGLKSRRAYEKKYSWYDQEYVLLSVYERLIKEGQHEGIGDSTH